MRTVLLDASAGSAVARAAALLRRAQVVAFPTETVYGLGADVFCPAAVARIFKAKRRPLFDPLIVHAASAEQAFALWKKVPPLARVLGRRFWPGPLTLVSEKRADIPDLVTGGLDTVAVRVPGHPVALALIRALGSPIAAPSANPFGYTSPTTASAVAEDLKGRIPLVLDGGPCRAGVESTILRIERGRCVLLRPGAVPVEALRRYCGKIEWAAMSKQNTPEAPGQLESHYAPRTPFVLMKRPLTAAAANRIFETERSGGSATKTPKIGLLLFRKNLLSRRFAAVETLTRDGNLVEAAANLFQAIRKLDKMGLDKIFAEPVPGRSLGLAIMDRLTKASSGKTL